MRLLDPVNPKDKYRPIKPDLPAVPFICDTDLPLDRAEKVLVIEGEIKAMVTFQLVDQPLLQVIGIPGKMSKTISAQIANDCTKHDLPSWWLFDPDGTEQAMSAAKLAGGRVITVPEKIDDMILSYAMTKRDIEGLMFGARKA
jgi:hypothetical protein